MSGAPAIEPQLDEPVLPDSYPVYGGYLYVADGKVVSSDVFGAVRDLKRDLKATQIRRCDIVGRRRASRPSPGVLT